MDDINNKKLNGINVELIKDSLDKMILLYDIYDTSYYDMDKDKLIAFTENMSQDIVYNLTQTIRNLTDKINN